MSVAEYIREAHATAIKKGFWGASNLNHVRVAEKLALVGTEIVEWFEARSFLVDGRDQVVELADICIRIFDLCGYLKMTLEPDLLEGNKQIIPIRTPEEIALDMFLATMRAVQAYRKDQLMLVRAYLSSVIRVCVDMAPGLKEAIEEKMEENKDRPHLHGRRY